MSEEKTYKKTQVAMHQEIAKDILNDIEISANESSDDFVFNRLKIRLSAFIYERTVSKKTLSYICPKPTFLDWFFGREKRIYYEVEIKDVLKNAPKNAKNELRTYHLNIKP